MAVEYSCILKELLGDGWVHLRGGGGGEGRPAGKKLQILDLYRLASLVMFLFLRGILNGQNTKRKL